MDVVDDSVHACVSAFLRLGPRPHAEGPSCALQHAKGGMLSPLLLSHVSSLSPSLLRRWEGRGRKEGEGVASLCTICYHSTAKMLKTTCLAPFDYL